MAGFMFNGTEHEGWEKIAAALTRALKQSVSISTAKRYHHASWPDPKDPHPLPLGQRGNGVWYLRADQDFAAWVEWYRGRPGTRTRAPRPQGDRRRGPRVAYVGA